MRFEELFAEIKSDLSKYDAAGLIDEIALVRDATTALKKFGNGITSLQEQIIEVKNGKATLPENFNSIFYAGLCKPVGYSTHEDRDNLISSHMYVERTTSTHEWNECDACCQDQKQSVIRENLYFKGNLTTFHYSAPRDLKLSKYIDRQYVNSRCRNKFVRQGVDEIMIDKFTLTANFESGYVYLMFYGLPRDEEGYLSIPETKSGQLETYIEYYLKRRLAERLIGNDDAGQGLRNLYSVYQQKELSSIEAAMTEIKMKAFTPRVTKMIARKNRQETLKFDINPEYQWQ